MALTRLTMASLVACFLLGVVRVEPQAEAWLNVLSFGALGDGLAADTDAFEQALSAGREQSRPVLAPGKPAVVDEMKPESKRILEPNISM